MVQLKPGQSLYEAIGVEKDADEAAIKSAYKKLALQLHPDRNPDNPEAKERFQTLQKIYSILSDPEKRKVYDRTGSLEDTEQLSGEQFDNLYNFYRSMYAPVTEEDIQDFSTTYKGGAEERADLLKYYEEFQGNMEKVFEWVILSDPEVDSHRFMDIIEDAIKKKEAVRYSKFTTWAKKVAKKPRPSAVDAAKGGSSKSKGKKKGKAAEKESDESALAAIIAKRRNSGGGFASALASLAERYGGGEEMPPEPSDADFEATRKRMEERMKENAKKRESEGAGEASGSGSKKKKK